jgi:ParB-like chromosome segregation protein Spo0J
MIYELHPFCIAFRRDNAEQQKAEIVANMRATGYDQTQPIVLYQGMILDGRVRYEAAQEAQVEPVFTSYDGDDDDARILLIRRNKARMTKGAMDLALATPTFHKDARTINNIAEESGRLPVQIAKARLLLPRAASNILDMVKADQISASHAVNGIRGKALDEQARMTLIEVKQTANAYNATHRRIKPEARRFTQPDIHLPPVDSTGTSKPNQRVHIWPAREEQLHDDSGMVANLEARITTLGRPLELVGSRQNTFEIDLETFKAAVARMLGYEKGKYRGSDFVADARRALNKIDAVIDRQIDWLSALRDFVRSAQPPATKASDEVSDGQV